MKREIHALDFLIASIVFNLDAVLKIDTHFSERCTHEKRGINLKVRRADLRVFNLSPIYSDTLEVSVEPTWWPQGTQMKVWVVPEKRKWLDRAIMLKIPEFVGLFNKKRTAVVGLKTHPASPYFQFSWVPGSYNIDGDNHFRDLLLKWLEIPARQFERISGEGWRAA